MSGQVIIITGASSGFGNLTARLLAQSGHIVYAGVRSHEVHETAALHAFAKDSQTALRTVILDVIDTASVEAAVEKVIGENGRIDTIVHNAGHGCTGPTEAYTPEQLVQYFDVNTVGTQRLNRSALPHMRKARKGLLVWVSSSSCRGGTPPFLGPYFAAKAALDSLAVSYAGELARWGIETTIIVPGAYTKGTNHFANMGGPADKAIAAEYMDGPYAGITEQVNAGLAALEPADSSPSDVAASIVRAVNLPWGKRPFRVHIDPSDDGAEIVNGVADRVRAELLRRVGLEDVLSPTIS
ncbi:short-chain oxidoreductase protein [Hyaloscypha variabilis]